MPYPEPLGTGLPGTGFDVATLPRTYSIEIPYDGTWQLFIEGGHSPGTVQPYSIGALVDNLRLVPEPGSLSLWLLGLGRRSRSEPTTQAYVKRRNRRRLGLSVTCFAGG